MEYTDKIYVAGHTGMVGSAILRLLKGRGYKNIVVRPHGGLDLTRQGEVEDFFQEEKPDYVFVAAAKVGGIRANSSYPVEFALDNMYIACNVLKAAHESRVKKLLYLGSACCYPNTASIPVKEGDLLNGSPEKTNEAYALAKNFGVSLCGYYRKEYGDDFIAAVPVNCYGENDCMDPLNSHVIPSLMQKYHRAKMEKLPGVELWGSGKPLREFIYVDDLADACLFLMEHYFGEGHINVGTGMELSILQLAGLISEVVGYTGKILCDPSKPDGKSSNALDSSRLFGLGWKPGYTMQRGLEKMYQWYLGCHMEGGEGGNSCLKTMEGAGDGKQDNY